MIPFWRSIRISAVVAAGRVSIRRPFVRSGIPIRAVAEGRGGCYLLEDLLKQTFFFRIASTLVSRNRRPLQPQREVGRQRVTELMAAAAAVIQERGFEATTMAEI